MVGAVWIEVNEEEERKMRCVWLADEVRWPLVALALCFHGTRDAVWLMMTKQRRP